MSAVFLNEQFDVDILSYFEKGIEKLLTALRNIGIEVIFALFPALFLPS